MAEYLYKILRVFLATVFIYSGVLKFLDINAFAETIGAYGLIPENFNGVLAIFISIVEIVGGILLLFDFLIGHLSVFTMLLAFIIILSYGVYLGLDIDCGCFGEGDHKLSVFSSFKSSILRDVLFISMSIYMFLYRFKNKVKKNYGGEDVSI